MKILYLTTVLPSKKRTGGEIASQYFIEALRQLNHEVRVVGYQRKDDTVTNSSNEISIAERYIETNRSAIYPFIWMLIGLLKNLPYSAAKYYSKQYIDQVNALLYREQYDLVFIDHAQLAWLGMHIAADCPMIFVAHNIEHEYYLKQVSNKKNVLARLIYQREARLIKRLEDTLANIVHDVWTLTAHDRGYFSSVKHVGAVHSFPLPSSFMPEADNQAEKEYDIGILGTWTWGANRAGLEWFFQSVYPLLPENLVIQVAGKGAEWLRGCYPNVNYCGFVPCTQTFMSQAKVVAIPSVSGGGIQIKTIDAIASGSRVTATPTALRGIVSYPRSVAVAETPEMFAQRIMQCIKAPTSSSLANEAVTWSRQRRRQFVADIDAALRSYAPQENVSRMF